MLWPRAGLDGMCVCEDDGRRNGVLPISYARVAINNDAIAPAPQGIGVCFNGVNHVPTRQSDVTSTVVLMAARVKE